MATKLENIAHEAPHREHAGALAAHSEIPGPQSQRLLMARFF